MRTPCLLIFTDKEIQTIHTILLVVTTSYAILWTETKCQSYYIYFSAVQFVYSRRIRNGSSPGEFIRHFISYTT